MILKRGFPEPGSHAERREALSKIGDDTFLYLNSYAYHWGQDFSEVNKSLKEVDEAIKYMHRKIEEPL